MIGVITILTALTLVVSCERMYYQRLLMKVKRYLEAKPTSRFELKRYYQDDRKDTWILEYYSPQGLDILIDDDVKFRRSKTGLEYMECKIVRDGEMIGKRALNAGLFNIIVYVEELCTEHA